MISLCDMSNTLGKYNIPSKALKPSIISVFLHRPILDTFVFDDWVHEKYGDYESEGKSLNDMFKLIFGDEASYIKTFFGVDDEKIPGNNER